VWRARTMHCAVRSAEGRREGFAPPRRVAACAPPTSQGRTVAPTAHATQRTASCAPAAGRATAVRVGQAHARASARTLARTATRHAPRAPGTVSASTGCVSARRTAPTATGLGRRAQTASLGGAVRRARPRAQAAPSRAYPAAAMDRAPVRQASASVHVTPSLGTGRAPRATPAWAGSLGSRAHRHALGRKTARCAAAEAFASTANTATARVHASGRGPASPARRASLGCTESAATRPAPWTAPIGRAAVVVRAATVWRVLGCARATKGSLGQRVGPASGGTRARHALRALVGPTTCPAVAAATASRTR